MHVVVDTNVILVANGSHADVSPDCVIECINRLEGLMKTGKVVIDDAHRILNEYQNKTAPMRNKRPGDVFVMWLLRNSANTKHVERVTLTEPAPKLFDDFPGQARQRWAEAPDRESRRTALARAPSVSPAQRAWCWRCFAAAT